eukprot:SAG31_NODE_6539_length_1983_cov_1.348195_1_plen_203_part_01
MALASHFLSPLSLSLSLSLSLCLSVSLIAAALLRMPVIRSLTIDSTGNWDHSITSDRKSYQLVAGDTDVNLANMMIGPADCYLLAELISINSPLIASAKTLNVLKNPIGDDGLRLLMESVNKSSIESICGLTAGSKSLDLNRQGLCKFDAKILAQEILLERSMYDSVKSFDIGGNEIASSDFDLLCSSIQNTSLEKISFCRAL